MSLLVGCRDGLDKVFGMSLFVENSPTIGGAFNKRVVLMLGAPRSGTTLLAAMLGAHDDVAMLMEDYYGGAFRILSKPLPGVKLCIPNQIELDQSKNLHRIRRALNKGVRFLNGILCLVKLPLLRGFNVPSFFTIRDYQKNADQLFIVGIIRHPQSAIESEKKRAGATDDAAERQWARAIEILYQLSIEDAELGRVIIVRYEDLIVEPKRVLDRICTSLGIGCSDKVLQGFKHTPQYQMNSIDASNVKEVHKRAYQTAHVFAHHPDLDKKYEHLLNLALKGLPYE